MIPGPTGTRWDCQSVGRGESIIVRLGSTHNRWLNYMASGSLCAMLSARDVHRY